MTRTSMKDISSLKDALNRSFSMTNLGLLSQFLGVKISQSTHWIKANQSKYASDLLNKFIMKDFNPSNTPFFSGVNLEEASSTPLVNNTLYRHLIGCFIYLTHTRTDISYAVSVSSIHIDQPHEIHWMEAKRILNFIQGKKNSWDFICSKI